MQAGVRLTLTLAAFAAVGANLVLGTAAAAKRQKSSGKPPGNVLQQHRGDLEQIEKEIEKREKQLGNLLKRESSIVSMLDELDRKIDAGRERKRLLDARRRELEGEIRDKSSTIGGLQQEIETLNDNIVLRLRNLYRLGDVGYMRLFLGLSDLRDLEAGARVARRVVASDLTMMRQFAEERRQLTQRRELLRAKQENLRDVMAELDRENTEIRERKQRQRHLLNLTRNQRDFHQRSLAELKEAATNLQELINKLIKEGFRSNFALLRGTLPQPVNGAIRGRFGRYLDEKFGTWFHRNGVEFQARSGEPVRAISTGKVIYSGWFTGYGKIVIVDHGDSYYSMSANLDEIHKQVGERVNPGETLGLVGETGSLRGPQLYFEMRYRGQAVDPLPWFRRNR